MNRVAEIMEFRGPQAVKSPFFCLAKKNEKVSLRVQTPAAIPPTLELWEDPARFAGCIVNDWKWNITFYVKIIDANEVSLGE